MDTTERTEITISLDMATDLQQVGIVCPDGAEYDDVDAFQADDDRWNAYLADMVERWTANAERIGVERGYDVTVVDGRNRINGGETGEVEASIWQDAHDATSVEPFVWVAR